MSQDHRSIARFPGGVRWLVAVVLASLAGLAAGDARAANRRRPLIRTAMEKHNDGDPVPPPRQASTPGGHVQFVTDKRAYLDRGSRDGLEEKQSLQIFRGGRAVVTCTIDTLAEHQATCLGGRPRPGDTFRASAQNGARKIREPRAPKLPPLVDQATLETRAAAVAEAPYEKVNFSGVRAFAAHTTAVLTPSITIWHTQSDPRGDYSQEQLEGTIHAYDLGATGLRFDAAFSAMRWGTRSGVGRFRPGTQTQFYLWEAEVSKRRVDAETVFAVGRIWPWHTPGLTLLDGFQIGRHNKTETAEGGVYAGLIPWALNVTPSAAGWASGVYGSLVQTGHTDAFFKLARQEARVGIWHGPRVGLVTEAEMLAQAWLGPANVGGGGRVRLAPSVAPQPALDRLYLDIGARATLALGGGLHVRYFGAALPDDALLGGEAVATRGSVHVIGDVHWDIRSWLGVAGFGGTHRDRDSGRSQDIGAAEVRFPRLFGDIGGAWLGAEINEGWLRGRLLYTQLFGRLHDRVQVLARLSASASQFQTPEVLPNVHELGAYLNIDGDILNWLRVRAFSLIRVPFLVQGEPPTDPIVSVVLGLSLTGVF